MEIKIRKERASQRPWKQTLNSESRKIASFYDQRAGYYDFLVHFLSFNMDGHYRRLAIERLNLRPGDRVLDLGCGTGLDLPLLSQKVTSKGRVTGVDLSKGMLHQAFLRLGRDGKSSQQYSNVSLIRGNAARLPLADQSFEAVFCNYLISTVPAVQVIEEAFRVAKPGARMVFADDRLPSGWFASPLKAIKGFWQEGYINCALPGLQLLRQRLDSVKITNHHGGLIFILSGVFNGAIYSAEA